MSWRKLLGALLLLLVFGGIFAAIGLTEGWLAALVVAAGSTTLAGVVLAGVWLLTED